MYSQIEFTPLTNMPLVILIKNTAMMLSSLFCLNLDVTDFRSLVARISQPRSNEIHCRCYLTAHNQCFDVFRSVFFSVQLIKKTVQ